jgi:hypothetical protein
VRNGDGRCAGPGCSQWNPEKPLVLSSLAKKGRCLGASVTVGCAHVENVANVLLRGIISNLQPEDVYVVWSHVEER